jgi:FMN-dependent NADH-azoreductase
MARVGPLARRARGRWLRVGEELPASLEDRSITTALISRSPDDRGGHCVECRQPPHREKVGHDDDSANWNPTAPRHLHPRGLASNTARVSSCLLEAMREEDDDLDVTTSTCSARICPRSPGRTSNRSTGSRPAGLDEAGQASWQQIERTIEQFLDADAYLLTVPMWNLGIPYVLKYYIDAIVQPGYLFRYTPDGRAEGLVHGKKMTVVVSSGGDYSNEFMAPFNFVESYLRAIFGFVGITDIHVIHAQGMDVGTDVRKLGQKTAIREARDYADRRMAPGSEPDARRHRCRVGRPGPRGLINPTARPLEGPDHGPSFASNHHGARRARDVVGGTGISPSSPTGRRRAQHRRLRGTTASCGPQDRGRRRERQRRQLRRRRGRHPVRERRHVHAQFTAFGIQPDTNLGQSYVCLRTPARRRSP